MKILIKNMILIIRNCVYFLLFLSRIIVSNNMKNRIDNSCEGKVAVLANGPSLKGELLKFSAYDNPPYKNFIVLNFFAVDDSFFVLKPKHYCFADPMFFRETARKSEVKELFKILNEKVTWDLSIYMPSHLYEKFINFSNITNKKIKLVRVNSTLYTGFECFRHFYYKKSLAMPQIQTVANLAIFIGINSGYEQLDLYGVDHTFLDSLSVNNKNQLCNKDSYFYKTDSAGLKPIVDNASGKVFKVSEYLFAIMMMFKSHELLHNYSKYLNVKIINCTNCSMIDSYERANL